MKNTPNTVSSILEAFEKAMEGGATYQTALKEAREAADNLPPEELKLARRLMGSAQTGIDNGHRVGPKPSLDLYDKATGAIAPDGIIILRAPVTNTGGNIHSACSKGSYSGKFPRWSAS